MASAKAGLLFTIITLLSFTSSAQTTVEVIAGLTWNGYMNVYDNTGTVYQFGSAWGVNDLKTEIDATTGGLTLMPNYNAYNAADPYWSNGAVGNKVMHALSYVESTSLGGQTVTFQGNASAYTIDAAYTVSAFVKVLDPANGYAAVVDNSTPITGTGAFTVSGTVPSTPGLITQYGFSVVGMNANPADSATLGSVVIDGDPNAASIKEITLRGNQNPRGITLNWTTSQEESMKGYTLEKSNDAQNYTQIYTVAAANISEASYSYTDANAGAENYYRVKCDFQNGQSKYSEIIKIDGAQLSTTELFPNPSTTHVVLNLPTTPKGQTLVSVYDTYGRLVSSASVAPTDIQSYKLSTEHLSGGSYIMVLSYDGHTEQHTFTKKQ